MERSEMPNVLHSAGEPGTPRCSEAETGSTDCQAVAHLVTIVAHDLVALRDMLGVADPELSLIDVGDQAAVMRSAMRMVATSGLMLDRALHLLGQSGACEDPMAWIGPHVPTLKPRAGEAA